MNLPEKKQGSEDAKPVPKVALIVMLVIVVALALISLFANFQRLRRDKIEEVIITPASTSPTPTPAVP